MNRRNYDSARKKVEAPSLLARGAAWVLTASLALLPACDWAAADGPWNHDLESAELLDPLAVGGALLTPDGSRPVAGALLQVEDALGAVPEQVSSDPDGVFAFVALPPERYTLLASSGQFAAARVLDLEGLREDQDLEPLRLSSTLPIVLDVRDAAAGDADPVDDRLRALGLSSVRVGPESAAEAADLFALPQGLFEYGLILIGGELDYEELLEREAALDGLRDFLEAGGSLYLSGEAWPLLDALAPGSLVLASGRSVFQFVQADVLDEELAEQLQWPLVGLPLTEGLPVPESVSVDARVWLSGAVQTDAGLVEEAPLAVEWSAWGGRLLYVPFAAPEPRPDEWWQGNPGPWALGDGTWDGRGTAIDRLLLGL